MKIINLILYNVFLKIYLTLIYLYSFSNLKAKKWLKGRKTDKTKISDLDNSRKIWVHASSLGEFEQGRPLIERIKNNFPDIPVVLTFFSPSGYEIQINYDYADFVFYLPLDGNSVSKKFIEKINPLIAIFVKYDFWYYYYKHLSLKKIPLVLISSNIQERHFSYPLYSKFFATTLSFVNHFYVQNEKSKITLNKYGFNNVSVTGDGRADRVYKLALNNNDFKDDIVDKFCRGHFTIILGSSYHTEEKMLEKYIERTNFNGKIIIAPHQVSVKRINEIIHLFHENAAIWSQCTVNDDFKEKTVLIIDTIGILKNIYKYSNLAIIGGGFNNGIHNLLEPIIYKVPVVFGPKNIDKFPEAKSLIKVGGGFLFTNDIEFSNILDKLILNENNSVAGLAAYNYVISCLGATDKIYEHLAKNFLKNENIKSN